jgi:hypothetical protein
MDHVNAFQKHSRFKIWMVNTEGGFPIGLKKIRFRIVVLHYSLFGYWPCLPLNNKFFQFLEESRESYKIAFFQDEYQFCKQRFDFINRFSIDCIYTLLKPEHFPKVYSKYTKVKRIIYTIPGYVSDELIELGKKLCKPDEERKIDIGYRGRQLEFCMGKGAREKTDIASMFRKRSQDLGLRLDIKTDEDSRIYGEAWYEFVAKCRAVLGVEAGVSIFDLEDKVLIGCRRLLDENPKMSFDEISEKILHRWEGNIPYRTISPRHFEAAVLRVCQILFEGEYSGILKPMVHYIPLKKDFSNFKDVILLFNNPNVRKELVDNTYRDLVSSGQYTYREFIAEFDHGLEEEGLSPSADVEIASRISKQLEVGLTLSKFYALLRTLRYYPYPGKEKLMRPLKPVVEKYRNKG